MSKALDDIIAERARQRGMIYNGKPCDELDKINTRNDWCGYLVAYIGRASFTHSNAITSFREMMVKTASIALAAVEAYDAGYLPDSIYTTGPSAGPVPSSPRS